MTHSNSNASYRQARTARLAPLALSLAAALAFAPSAQAALGGAPITTPAGASVRTLSAAAAQAAANPSNAPLAKQAAQASATSSTGSTAAAPYTVRETTLASGTVVREYVSQTGTVFGIAWSGMQQPDLSDLLGSYFPQYIAGLEARRAAGAVRGPGIVEQPGLVVHSGGHMGAFSGQAWLPQSLPAGVTAADIQ